MIPASPRLLKVLCIAAVVLMFVVTIIVVSRQGFEKPADIAQAPKKSSGERMSDKQLDALATLLHVAKDTAEPAILKDGKFSPFGIGLNATGQAQTFTFDPIPNETADDRAGTVRELHGILDGLLEKKTYESYVICQDIYIGSESGAEAMLLEFRDRWGLSRRAVMRYHKGAGGKVEFEDADPIASE
ncbi:MAG TPA: hypothetical protein V6C86_05640 [Oculatellaceae cyanobacterium]